jgi:hypothetical protein
MKMPTAMANSPKPWTKSETLNPIKEPYRLVCRAAARKRYACRVRERLVVRADSGLLRVVGPRRVAVYGRKPAHLRVGQPAAGFEGLGVDHVRLLGLVRGVDDRAGYRVGQRHT